MSWSTEFCRRAAALWASSRSIWSVLRTCSICSTWDWASSTDSCNCKEERENITERGCCRVIVWRQHKADKIRQNFRKWSRQTCTAESVHQFYSVLLLRELLRLTFVHVLQRLLVLSLLFGQQRLIMLDGVVPLLWFKSIKNARWRQWKQGFVLDKPQKNRKDIEIYCDGQVFFLR